MARLDDAKSSRLFISYATENQDVARRLQFDLQRDGVEVFVDFDRIIPGESLPARINAGLGWCDTLVLLWSEHAAKSYYVAEEWETAFHLQRRIIPCLLDNTALPPLLSRRMYLTFYKYDDDYPKLCKALSITPKAGQAFLETKTISEILPLPVSDPESVIQPADTQAIKLRRDPLNPLSEENIRKMLHEKNFFDGNWNKTGKGLSHQYEIKDWRGAKFVLDHATGLVWQQGGSENYMNLHEAEVYIQRFNLEKYGGYEDWRLPTLEEAMSLIESEMKNGEVYIDPVFDRKQRWIWTSDRESDWRAWFVSFGGGGCDRFGIGIIDGYLRAVR